MVYTDGCICLYGDGIDDLHDLHEYIPLYFFSSHAVNRKNEQKGLDTIGDGVLPERTRRHRAWHVECYRTKQASATGDQTLMRLYTHLLRLQVDSTTLHIPHHTMYT
jgi:hypothetical protein